MVKVYGSSDDLIEVEGTVRAEFSVYDDKDRYLVFSDGTVAKVYYDQEGIWRIRVVVKGTAKLVHDLPEGEDDYSEVLSLLGEPITWVVEGKSFVQAE